MIKIGGCREIVEKLLTIPDLLIFLVNTANDHRKIIISDRMAQLRLTILIRVIYFT